jgi:ribonuclease-3
MGKPPARSSGQTGRAKSPFRACLEPGRKEQLSAFQKAVGFRFKSLELLNLAFIHRSVSNESFASRETGGKINNERLEFLGDSVLGVVCASLLYEKYPDKSEGELAKIKSVAVSEDILSGIARLLQLDTLLILGKGEELTGGRTKKALLADAMEALIGALYLDSGYKAAFDFVSRYLVPEIDRVRDTGLYRDYKSLLQELCQQYYRTYPDYRLVKQSGPEHDRMFWVEVGVNGRQYGPGMGRNKKSAEQEAARMAWADLAESSSSE